MSQINMTRDDMISCFGTARIKEVLRLNNGKYKITFEYDRICEICNDALPDKYRQCHKLAEMQAIYEQQAMQIKQYCRNRNYNTCMAYNSTLTTKCIPSLICEACINDYEI
jgi:hypothetical protein